jgi:enoyl-CoA hydratase
VIGTERVGDVWVVAIDRHERRNAVDAEHCELLRAAVRQATVDGARAIVITGRGSSFCSGADLGTVYGGGFRDSLYGMLGEITRTPVPVVAAVNGPAIGAGTQLAIACDLRAAADTARFAVPTARNGLAVDPWTVRRLALLAGGGTARALLIGCDTLDADQAYGRGLVDRRGDLDAAMAWATEIAGLAPLTLAYSKLALDRLLEPTVDDPDVAAAFAACWASDDLAEAGRARTEKRQPRFTGR